MFIPALIFPPKKSSFNSTLFWFINANDLFYRPGTHSRSCAPIFVAPSLGNTGHSHPSQAVQPMQTLTLKTFHQLRLRKLNPPSSNIVKYSFSLQPIMNNSFILQPIIFNLNFSSGQRKAPIFRRKAC